MAAGQRVRSLAGRGLMATLLAAGAGACGSPKAAGGHPAARPTTATVAPTTLPAPTTTQAPPTTPAPTTTSVDPGLLPQTTAVPTRDAQFQAEMADLWQAVTTGEAVLGAPSFFPETAYVKLKALGNDSRDWNDRLFARFALDIAAAHRLVSSEGGQASLVDVLVAGARWIPPGRCYNRIGYWFSPDARVVYKVGGATRSFGIAALDSWRGEWYVIHLGSELEGGVVDSPQEGAGVPGEAGGC